MTMVFPELATLHHMGVQNVYYGNPISMLVKPLIVFMNKNIYDQSQSDRNNNLLAAHFLQVPLCVTDRYIEYPYNEAILYYANNFINRGCNIYDRSYLNLPYPYNPYNRFVTNRSITGHQFDVIH